MVEHQTDALNAVFRALGDPTRREMLRQLAGGERAVGELARPFRRSLAAASKHMKVPEPAGRGRRRVQGRTHLCRLEARGLGDAHEWLSLYRRFWTERFDALDALLVPRAEPDGD